MAGQRRHYRELAMDQESGSLSCNAPMPGEEFALIGMRRKPVYRMDAGPNRNVVSENADGPRAIDDLPRQRSRCRVADEDHGRILFPKIVAKMMQDAAAGAHPRTGHDHGASHHRIDGHRIGALSHHFQTGEMEGILRSLEKSREMRVVRFGMTLKISVADTAIGESTNTGIDGGIRPSSVPWRRK
jgi:hypothetical protein